MIMSYNKPIHQIAIVGTGVIGASWAAQYLARGFDVVATDPAPNAEANLRKYVDEAWEQLKDIGLSPGASRDRLSFTANMKEALSKANLLEGFMNSASPGTIAVFQPNEYYSSHEAYLEALANAMREEYETIVNSGLLLQLDCPDLAMGRHTRFKNLTDEQFLRNAELQVEALNHALANVPADRVRLHICWGNYEGSHVHDIDCRKIFPIAIKVKPMALLVEGANPRHEHEWEVWTTIKLPDDKILIPGVIGSNSNYVEHPEVVAQRILRYANIVGRERVIAGTDCGFGTFAGFGAVYPAFCWMKMRSLSEGARLATQRLWGRASAN